MTRPYALTPAPHRAEQKLRAQLRVTYGALVDHLSFSDLVQLRKVPVPLRPRVKIVLLVFYRGERRRAGTAPQEK